MQGQETTTGLKPTRASFIRSLPVDMPVQEVVERGREVGLEIQPSDIHAARYYMRQQASGEVAPPTKNGAKKSALTPMLVRDPANGAVSGSNGSAVTGHTGVATGSTGANGNGAAASGINGAGLAGLNGKRSGDKEIKHAGVQLITSRPADAGAVAAVTQSRAGATVVKSTPVASGSHGTGRRRLYMPDPTGTPEEMLRLMIRRLGTKRARSIIEEMEAGTARRK